MACPRWPHSRIDGSTPVHEGHGGHHKIPSPRCRDPLGYKKRKHQTDLQQEGFLPTRRHKMAVSRWQSPANQFKQKPTRYSGLSQHCHRADDRQHHQNHQQTEAKWTAWGKKEDLNLILNLCLKRPHVVQKPPLLFLCLCNDLLVNWIGHHPIRLLW